MVMTKEDKEEFRDLKLRVLTIEKKIDKILTIVKGIAIGIAIGAIIFGVLSLKDLISIAK